MPEALLNYSFFLADGLNKLLFIHLFDFKPFLSPMSPSIATGFAVILDLIERSIKTLLFPNVV
jgi:hypothetical protein